MAETHTSIHSDSQPLDIAKIGNAAGLLGLICIAISIVRMFQGDNDLATGSYIFGFIFWAGISIGMFALTLLHHAVRGSWTVSILRLLEAGGGPVTLTVVAALFIPVMIGVWQGHTPYEWAHPAAVAADKALQHKAPYLNPTAWSVRWAIFFGSWIAVASLLRRSTLLQDKTKNFRLEELRSTYGALSLPVFVLMVTFAMTDWVMSLNPHWYSTMYGPWSLISAVLGALAFCVVILCSNYDRAPFNSIIGPGLLKDLGNMLFAFTMLWGYTTLSQFLIIWNGNLPETTSYFITRSSANRISNSSIGNPGMGSVSWGALGMLLIVGQFFIPFFTLLSPRTKRFSWNLRKIAGWIFVIHIFDVYMLVAPSIPGRAAKGPITTEFFWDLLAFIGVGGIWMWSFASQTSKAGLITEYDTRLQEALAHAH